MIWLQDTPTLLVLMNVRTLQATKELWEAHNSIADSVLVVLLSSKNMAIGHQKWI